MSLLHPPPGFPPHLALVWPLIWVQVLVLRAAMRAAYGKGVQYHWSVTPCGRVFLASVDWIPGRTKTPDWLKPAAHPNARIAAALSGEAMIPEGLRTRPDPAGPIPDLVRTFSGHLRAPSGVCTVLPLPDS